jgi:hypothetical protein
MTPSLLEPVEDMRPEDIAIDDIRVYGEAQRQLMRLHPVVNRYMPKKVPGFIRKVRFRNVTVEGQPGDYLVQIERAGAERDVREMIFDNVSVLGLKLILHEY